MVMLLKCLTAQRFFMFILCFHLFATPTWAVSFNTIDDLFLQVSEEETRFAGAYKDQGRLVLLTTDGLPLKSLGSLEHLDISNEAFENARVESAELSFKQLHTIYNHLLTMIDTIPHNITSTDIDERANKIRIAVGLTDQTVLDDEVLLDEQRASIISFFDIPTLKPLKSEFFDIVFFLTVPGSQPPNVGIEPPFFGSEKTLFSPLQQNWGGTPIYNQFSRCTFGFTATINNTKGMITNSHCDAGNAQAEFHGPIADVFLFGNSFFNFDNPTFAKKLIDPVPIIPGLPRSSVATDLPIYCNTRVCRHSDSMLAQYVPGFDAPAGIIARPDEPETTLVLNQQQPTFKITKKGGFVLLGETVHKVGSSTGWTSGEVTRTCFNSISDNVSLVCQNVSDASIFSGDSGSPVFTIEPNGTDVHLRGLAHTAFFSLEGNETDTGYSPINQIERDLGQLENVFAEADRPLPSLNIQQIPGYVTRDHVVLKNGEPTTFSLNVLEAGRYDLLIQSASELDSRIIEIEIGDEVFEQAIDAFNTSDTNTVAITTTFLDAGIHELTVKSKTSSTILRQIQAVKNGDQTFPISDTLVSVSRLLGPISFSNGTIPGFAVTSFSTSTSISPQETIELEIDVLETGNYQFDLLFDILQPSQEIALTFNGQTIRRALDGVDINRETSLLKTAFPQQFKFFNVPEGKSKLTITSLASHEIVLKPLGRAILIK